MLLLARYARSAAIIINDKSINEFSAGIPVISNAEIFSLLLLHVLACSNYA